MFVRQCTIVSGFIFFIKLSRPLKSLKYNIVKFYFFIYFIPSVYSLFYRFDRVRELVFKILSIFLLDKLSTI